MKRFIETETNTQDWGVENGPKTVVCLDLIMIIITNDYLEGISSIISICHLEINKRFLLYGM